LLVPSLINRHDILDLDPAHSFAAYLSDNGFDPYILAWGPPADAERTLTINDYITQRLLPALDGLNKRKGPVHMLGYCMGGTMAAAATSILKNQTEQIASLTLLAAPWDFQAGDRTLSMRMQAFAMTAEPVMDATGTLPVDWIQALFASIDPLFAFNKFRAFAEMDKDSPEARRFVIVEDWLNDGVDLTAPAARQALHEWYVDNQPVNGVWTIGPDIVDVSKIKVPTLVVAAANDRLVPQQSALAIMQQIDAGQSLTPDIGHIGMMASPRATKAVWQPVVDFLKAQR
jgi:polyhydroxyalkanoate synthase